MDHKNIHDLLRLNGKVARFIFWLAMAGTCVKWFYFKYYPGANEEIIEWILDQLFNFSILIFAFAFGIVGVIMLVIKEIKDDYNKFKNL